MKTVLGFDVSSSCIGYCQLQVDETLGTVKFISCGYIKPIKKGDIIDRVVHTRNKIKEIIEKIKPDYIGIEDIIQFMKGHSTAKTIIMLTTFNRMIGLTSYDYLGRSPNLFSVMTIRHFIKKQAKMKLLPKKEDLPEILEGLLNIKFDWEFNKNGKIKIENYDKSDAVCCAYYCAMNVAMPIKNTKIKGKSK